MKKFLFALAGSLTFGLASAQEDPARNPQDPTKTKVDTSATLQRTDQKNMKKSDAVKTKDHNKTTRKAKSAKDTTTTGNRRNP